MVSKSAGKNPGCCGQASTVTPGQEKLFTKIKEVAQKLYEERGRAPGHELEDWLKAEKIVKRECRA